MSCGASGSDLDPPGHALAIKDLERVLGGRNSFVKGECDVEALELFMVDQQLHSLYTSDLLLCCLFVPSVKVIKVSVRKKY